MGSKHISIRIKEDVDTDINRLCRLIGGRKSKVINWILKDWISKNAEKMDLYERRNKA